ncbi:MAG: NUDIX domain-containing protein [Brumimicrobium sp.]|nr:NUDIX domain-containing protein [Brumimicrobium sp.]
MYKVFIDNTFISFRKSFFYKTDIPEEFLPALQTEKLEEFLNYINSKASDEPILTLSPNPSHALRSFFKNFRWIEAAGGIVRNTKTNKSLFMIRHGKWDIPKGKIEEGESIEEAAKREITEECGIQHLEITKELSPTYHVYHAYGDFWIKKTYWYVLETEETEVNPQSEEGISSIEWLDADEISKVEENTYASILDVIAEYGTSLI